MAKTWTPDANYSAYGSDYFEQGNKYGNGMTVAGATAAPTAPDQPKNLADMKRKDMNQNQRQRWNQYQQDQQAYDREMKRYNASDSFYSNQNPYEYFSGVLNKAGYTPGGDTGFEGWLKDEFAQIQSGYDSANQINNQLNFNDYLATFGSPEQFGTFLLNRFRSRTPDQQGMSGQNAYGGPSRWSVF